MHSNALHRDLARLVERVEREDGPRAAADPYRQRFHLMPPVGWLNDPNGLCRCGEWYHVFYQYGPFDAAGGVKHWGHYRSRDLLQWEKLPVMPIRMSRGTSTAYIPAPRWSRMESCICITPATSSRRGIMTISQRDAGIIPHMPSRGRGIGAVRRAAAHQRRLSGRTDLSCARPQGMAAGWDVLYGAGARTLDDRGEILVFESADKRRWRHRNTLTTPEKFGYMWECPDLFGLEGLSFSGLLAAGG